MAALDRFPVVPGSLLAFNDSLYENRGAGAGPRHDSIYRQAAGNVLTVGQSLIVLSG